MNLLSEIATVERAKKGKLYPKHSTIIQISATKGQIEYTKVAAGLRVLSTAVPAGK